MGAALTLAFGWEPEIRGITVVLIMIVVLVGSVYLLLGTNLGSRLGFLVAITGLAGWMFLMGAIWWVYGIGLQGTMPSWKPVEIVAGDLSTSSLEEARRLPDGWESLPADDPARGQAQASADEILTVETSTFTSTTEYLPLNVYETGGETFPSWFFNIFHKPHFAVVQVQPVVPQVADPGQAAPTPVPDTSQPVLSVVMVRDLGDRRFPPAMVTLGSGIIFALCANALHRRDKAVAQAQAEAAEQAKELEKV